MAGKRPGQYVKFILYVAVVVLINVAGLTLFFRADLTKDDVFSISEASRRVVSTLSEPLTINVFFTKNLPALKFWQRQGFQRIVQVEESGALILERRFHDV